MSSQSWAYLQPPIEIIKVVRPSDLWDRIPSVSPEALELSGGLRWGLGGCDDAMTVGGRWRGVRVPPRATPAPARAPPSRTQYPEGYLEALARKEKENSKREAEEEEPQEEEEGGLTSPRRGKRKSKSAGGCPRGRPLQARGAGSHLSAPSQEVARTAPGPREGRPRKPRWSPTASRPSSTASSRRTGATRSCGPRP